MSITADDIKKAKDILVAWELSAKTKNRSAEVQKVKHILKVIEGLSA